MPCWLIAFRIQRILRTRAGTLLVIIIERECCAREHRVCLCRGGCCASRCAGCHGAYGGTCAAQRLLHGGGRSCLHVSCPCAVEVSRDVVGRPVVAVVTASVVLPVVAASGERQEDGLARWSLDGVSLHSVDRGRRPCAAADELLPLRGCRQAVAGAVCVCTGLA